MISNFINFTHFLCETSYITENNQIMIFFLPKTNFSYKLTGFNEKSIELLFKTRTENGKIKVV